RISKNGFMNNISIIEVRPKDGVAWDDFYDHLSQLLEKVEDRDNTVVICRELSDDWQPCFHNFRSPTSEREVAWVRFGHEEGHFHMAFIAWSKESLDDCVTFLSNTLLDGQTTATIQEAPTIH